LAQVLRHGLERPQIFHGAVEAALKDKSLKVSNLAATLRMGFGYTKARRPGHSRLAPVSMHER